MEDKISNDETLRKQKQKLVHPLISSDCPVDSHAPQGEAVAAEETGFLGMTHELEKHLPALLQSISFWHCHNMSL